MSSRSHLVLIDLLLQDLISVRVNLHLLLLLQLPPQSGQILLEGIMGEEESLRAAANWETPTRVTYVSLDGVKSDKPSFLKYIIPALVSGCCSPSPGQCGSPPQRPGSP